MLIWNPQFETGHENIDAEHREFFRLLNDLEAALHTRLEIAQAAELIVVLQQYVNGHFQREEAHMACVKCPAHAANCAAHREFSRKLDGWLTLLTSGVGTPVSLLLDVHRASCTWIETHIMSIDRQLLHCPNERPPG